MVTDTEAARPALSFRSNADVAVAVPDLERAERFYAGTLGFEVIGRGDAHLALDTGTFRLWVNLEPGTARSFIPSFDVESGEAARRHLLDHGCDVVAMGSGGEYYVDPFGFAFDVVERPTAP